MPAPGRLFGAVRPPPHVRQMQMSPLQRMYRAAGVPVGVAGAAGDGERRGPLSRLMALGLASGGDKKGEEKITILHRLLAAGTYAMPLMDTLQAFIQPLMFRFPGLESIMGVVGRAAFYYTAIPLLPFFLFMGAYFVVIRKNSKIKFPYFVRYNVMQSLIITMFQYFFALFYFRMLGFNPLDDSMLNEVLILTIVMGSLLMIGNCIVTAVMGGLPQIPLISEGVGMHIGDGPQIPRSYGDDD
ncbi:unnamed protein product [Vitrella brassicaformis CCMP3155]|uniref:Tic20 family protein Ycf60 n=1 Tax=Vitrella brassicaformis (strain CCMP3155) TaxID=1169540 RepID=A0A0G4EVF0_VITBC|nr:unnamed protein product [Vitrella brassicaformis CCMP3155]|eukprot:CEM02245.1 unnamed protein product [Vitrella brassicaformis CCMP3155]